MDTRDKVDFINNRKQFDIIKLEELKVSDIVKGFNWSLDLSVMEIIRAFGLPRREKDDNSKR